MNRHHEDRRPPPSDPEQGVWQGRSIARRFVSPDGFTVLVGRGDRDNDLLTTKLAQAHDSWFHVAGESGSHVVVRNPDRVDPLPKTTVDFAAGLAAGYSKARRGGSVAVHQTRCSEVSKGRGLPPGKVQIRRFRTIQARPLRADDLE